MKDINKKSKTAFAQVTKFDPPEINKAIAKFGFNKLVEFDKSKGFNELVEYDKSKNVACSYERGIYIFTIVDNPNSQQIRDDWNSHIENRVDSKITKLNSKKIVSRLVLYIGSSKDLRKRLGEYYKRPDGNTRHFCFEVG